MAGLVPATHVYIGRAKDVDGRHEGGHDETKSPAKYSPCYSVQTNRTAVVQARP